MPHKQKPAIAFGYRSLLLALFISIMVLGGCSNSKNDANTDAEAEDASPSLIPPDASGEQLFNTMILGTQAGCVTCHSLDGTAFLGPSLQGIGSFAQDRIPGMSAEAYIRQSILDPEAFVIEESPPGLMPPHYEDALSAEHLDALVAFLMSQKTSN